MKRKMMIKSPGGKMSEVMSFLRKNMKRVYQKHPSFEA
jgi:hypothetical protein